MILSEISPTGQFLEEIILKSIKERRKQDDRISNVIGVLVFM